MKILITGASSYVGAKIYTDLKNKFETIGTYLSNKLFDELKKFDITNQIEVIKFVSEVNPDLIIHVAANSSGGWCDKNPELAKSINEKGTKYIIEAANKVNSKVIYISSFAAINPSMLYGETKLNGEHFVKETIKGFNILRPSLIVGYSPNTSNDRPFNRFLKNIHEHTPAVYDTSWKFQPTYLRHISEVIEKIIELNINNEIIPIAVSELKSRFDLATDILTPFNIKVQPENKQDKSPTFNEGLNKLKDLNLPEYTYSEVINNIIQEIKDNF
ncbi:MAG: sugar nucleotide-binding protein [Nanoarchaeota archaeon]|jgi:dTDP-4-dehydrorhamnose reductase|nr:sugar nucleotide-binding protein [Nanoarchaeota archaeon]